jgi:hypothetical protein
MKCAGVALTDLIESIDANFRAIGVMNYHIIQVIRGIETVTVKYHRATISKVKSELKKHNEVEYKQICTALHN